MNCTPTLVDMGLDDFYGYSYFFCLYWTCSGLRANIVEEYVLLSASLGSRGGAPADSGRGRP